jgi:hypothetical protein
MTIFEYGNLSDWRNLFPFWVDWQHTRQGICYAADWLVEFDKLPVPSYCGISFPRVWRRFLWPTESGRTVTLSIENQASGHEICCDQ